MFKVIVLLSVVVLSYAHYSGYEPIDINSPVAQEAANAAAKEMSMKFLTPFHYKLGAILSVEKQINDNTHFMIDIIVGLTKCKKTEYTYGETVGCELVAQRGTFHKCSAFAIRDSKGHYDFGSSHCVPF